MRSGAAYLTSLLKEYGIEDGLVLDLGCGTGSLTETSGQEGYDMIGQWISPGHASDCHGKEGGVGTTTFSICCRICGNLSCMGQSGPVVSICDSMNYLLEHGDLVQVLLPGE